MDRAALAAFIARRLVGLVVLLAIISFGIFSLLHVAPGSAVEILTAGRPPLDPEAYEALVRRHRLDLPFLAQYGYWVMDAFHGDLGTSIRTGETVTAALSHRMGLTLFLGAYAFLIIIALGIPMGILAAMKKRTVIDRATVATSIVGVSAPAFVTGIFLLYIFAVLLGWFPAFGQGVGFSDQLRHLTLPAVALAFTGIAPVLRFTRTAMIQTLEQDYIVFALARGMPRLRILLTYGLRNALIPVVTSAGLILGVMLTGAVLVEVVFSLPGLGSLLIEAVNWRDVPVVQGLAVITAALIIVINLITDILYVVIDPRIRFGRVAA